MKKIVKIMPHYEPRMWGGGIRLKEEFHYDTDVSPLGEVYNVVALPGHADCEVPEMNCTLSELYNQKPEWFECETKQLPVRVNILDPMEDLSIQIHPDDAFAKSYNGGRGKPEAWVILDAPKDGYIEFGHWANSKEEFIEWTRQKEWKKTVTLSFYTNRWIYRYSYRYATCDRKRSAYIQYIPKCGFDTSLV